MFRRHDKPAYYGGLRQSRHDPYKVQDKFASRVTYYSHIYVRTLPGLPVKLYIDPVVRIIHIFHTLYT